MHLFHIDTLDSLISCGSIHLYSPASICAANAIAEKKPDYHSKQDRADSGTENRRQNQADSKTDNPKQGQADSGSETPKQEQADSGTENRGANTGKVGSDTQQSDDRISEAEAIRLAMALIEGAQHASEDRAKKAERLRERIRLIGGQVPASDDETNESLGNRLRSLSRTNDRNLAEQLRLQVRFDNAEHYKLDGCRSMIVWMDVHLGIAKINASEQLRVGRALQHLPILESLFTLGQISFSQLREVTRVATSKTDAEFALATLALSVSETREYCLRFRHDVDRDEDARMATQHGQDISDAHAALRAYERRSLSMSEPDAHSTRIVIELPRELGEEFRRSLEQCEDWIREGGDNPGLSEAVPTHEKPDISTSYHNQNTMASLPEKTQSAVLAKPTATQQRVDAVLLMSRRSLAHAGQAVAMADRYRVHVNLDFSQLLESFPDASASSVSAENEERSAASQNETHSSACEFETVVERPWLHGAGPVSRATAQRLAGLAGFTLVLRDDDNEVFATANKAPPFTKSQLRTLRARDRCCQMPGCGSTRHAEGHHIVHRENGGQSSMDNAVHLCGACHRLLHEGGFRLERIGLDETDLGLQAQRVNADIGSRARAQAKVNRIRRYRLYGLDGREYSSVNTARASMNMRETAQQPQQPQQCENPAATVHPTQKQHRTRQPLVE